MPAAFADVKDAALLADFKTANDAVIAALNDYKAWLENDLLPPMTVQQAQDMFVNEAYQPAPVAESEAKRGTSDATYGYYTMGKLMILKLRDDYKAKMGEKYSLKDFHDTFIKLGPLPVPLIRNAMLGDIGNPF